MARKNNLAGYDEYLKRNNPNKVAFTAGGTGVPTINTDPRDDSIGGFTKPRGPSGPYVIGENGETSTTPNENVAHTTVEPETAISGGNAGGQDGGQDDLDEVVNYVTKEAEPDPTYEALRYSSAKDLLDANVMTQLSNEIARKNMNNDLAAMGLANSGYAGTASALRENANQAQLMQNQRAYNDALRQIDYDEKTAEQATLAAEASSISDNISKLSQESRDAYLTSRGLVFDKESNRWVNGKDTNYTQAMLNGINDAYFVSNNGASENSMVTYTISNLASLTYEQRSKEMERLGLTYDEKTDTWSKGKDSKITDDELALLNTAWRYASYNDALTQGNGSVLSDFSYDNNSLQTLLNTLTISGGVSADADKWGITNEAAYFLKEFAGKTMPEGYVVRLTNGNSDNHCVLVYRNGKWMQGTDADYDSADDAQKRNIKGADDKALTGLYPERKDSEQPKNKESSEPEQKKVELTDKNISDLDRFEKERKNIYGEQVIEGKPRAIYSLNNTLWYKDDNGTWKQYFGK